LADLTSNKFGILNDITNEERNETIDQMAEKNLLVEQIEKIKRE